MEICTPKGYIDRSYMAFKTRTKHMKIKLTFSLILLTSIIFAQSKTDYLSQNRVDLRNEKPNLTETDFKIIGFGALHGSSKTYEAELNLVKWLLGNDMLDYYIIEANFSQAFFVQEYLETGDEELLKELTYAFQTMVSQEGTIETFNHWKNVRNLLREYPERSIKIIGCSRLLWKFRWNFQLDVYLLS